MSIALPTWFLQMSEKEARDFLTAGIQPRVTADDLGVGYASDIEMTGAFLQESVSNNAQLRESLRCCHRQEAPLKA